MMKYDEPDELWMEVRDIVQETVKDREAWHAAVYGVTKSQT